MNEIREGSEAVRELLSGGKEGSERFARQYRLVILKAVHVAAYRYRASEADVEDAASEVYLELWKEDAKLLRSFQGRSAFTTWLSVIAYRIASREFARRIRARAAESAKRPKADEARDVEALEFLQRLPEVDRRSLVMFHLHDFSYREISDRLGIPLNQVGMVLLRAREKMARMLGGSPE